MNFQDHTFRDEDVRIHGNTFSKCRFENCKLLFDASTIAQLDEATLVNARWEFEGAALHTIELLATAYHYMGDEGRDMVDFVFDQIRRNPPTPTPLPHKAFGS